MSRPAVPTPSVALLGFYSALAAFLATLGYGVVQLLQVGGVLPFPYDEISIFGFSLFIAPPFLLAMAAVHHSMDPDARIWSLASLLFAVMYTVYACLMYALQLGVVIPRLTDATGLALLANTPHSFLWTVDALAYLCMGVSAFFAGLAFTARNGAKWLRRFLLAHGLVTPLIAVAYFYPRFSITVLFIGAPWLITAPGSMLLLVLFFGRQRKEAAL